MRRSHHRLVAGVASGMGDRFHIEPNLVRLAFVVLTLAGGIGIVLYAAGWALLPTADDTQRADEAGPERPRNDPVQVAALGAVTVGMLMLATSMGFSFGAALLWPMVLAALGTALLVGRSGRSIDELIGELVRRERGLPRRDDSGPHDTAAVLRVVTGGALVVAGVGAFLATQGAFRAVGQGLLAVAVMLGGLGLIFGPWLWRLWNALIAERSERIRSDERAEMAAHLHDSVLQTLALIQRRADDPRVVRGLARSQERELRAWLFGRAPARADLDLGDALEAAAADVEQRQGVPIDTVRVGGACPLDDRLRALVAASQEAMVNAARHSGANVIAVYGEVEVDQVSVFVRDKGRGFDPAGVPTDRGGIAESIVGRMQRNGGVAVIRSRPGHGTEVELSVKRIPA
jgi:signal transduction histidine kinase/phage shock protein PspC (stress-responsive transcriptional regulator)